MKRVVIYVSGTRGDLQPGVILARTLTAHGHQVTIFADKAVKKLLRKTDKFTVVESDFDVSAFPASEEGKKLVEKSDMRSLEIAMDSHDWVPTFRRGIELCRGSDIIISGTFGGHLYHSVLFTGILLGKPVYTLSFFYNLPTGEYPNQRLFGDSFRFRWMNRFTYYLLEGATQLKFKNHLDWFRKEYPLTKFPRILTDFTGYFAGVVNAYSYVLQPPPIDMNIACNVLHAGYIGELCDMDLKLEDVVDSLDETLLKFLKKCKRKPFYVCHCVEFI